jgi:GH15 family glucan-1,4-alpha-glucosidase
VTGRPFPSGDLPLDDYGLIGNLETCALVSRTGSVDWLCLPRLDSPSLLAALLDAERGGRLQVSPRASYHALQTYREDSNVLETTMTTATGEVVVTDFMPVRNHPGAPRALARRVRVSWGSVPMRAVFDPRPDYARAEPALQVKDGQVSARSGDQNFLLRSSLDFAPEQGRLAASWRQRHGEEVWLVLGDAQLPAWSWGEWNHELHRTLQFWRTWLHRSPETRALRGTPWRRALLRSGLVLKLLCCDPGGGIAAAPTTSLPEEVGGVRNWDYRYSWIRDASFTVQALYHLGFAEEARNHLAWFREICAQTEDFGQLRVLYTLDRKPAPPEQQLGHLAGYRGSKPVRIGNGAVDQRQLDIYGELVNAFYETVRYDKELSHEHLGWVRRLADYVSKVWSEPDAGIWEVRSAPRHHTYSKLMCWVALDRAVQLVSKRNPADPSLPGWKAEREKVRAAILEQGYSSRLGSFVQSFGGEELDATNLLIPLMEFLPADDPRVQGTIDATIQHLTENGLVLRYRNVSEDGLAGAEGTFLLCSFWLVSALAISDRLGEAEQLMERLVELASPLGLLSEEITADGELLGNFPQAYSHIGLINSALYLEAARQRGSGAQQVPLVGQAAQP